VDVSRKLRSLPVRMSGTTLARQPEPVTVTVARTVRPEQHDAFERWAADVQALVATFPGNLGTSLLRPGPASDEYHLVYRFADDDALAAWERSAERQQALERVHQLVEDERFARAVGLETFFAVPPRPGPAWRSWLLTVLTVFSLSSTFQLVAVPVVGGWPWPLRLALSTLFVVSTLRVLMPRLSRWLAPWLEGRRR
jgi:uncharacterized protein